jgi:predicted small lipoprotein YifL
MNRIGLIISFLFIIMILSCWGCGKKGPPVLPKVYSSADVINKDVENEFMLKH